MGVAELLDAVIGGLGEWPGMPPVHVDGARRLPDVHVDAVRIGHVLVNLVDNARRYGGTGAIGIRARRQRSTVVITVEDDGPGIPPDERALVFDRLYRGRAARDAHPGGTGTRPPRLPSPGRGARGRIWIEPEPGRSAISFSVPVARRSHVAGAGEPA